MKAFNLTAIVLSGLGIPYNMFWMFVYHRAMRMHRAEQRRVSGRYKPKLMDMILSIQSTIDLFACILFVAFNLWIYRLKQERGDDVQQCPDMLVCRLFAGAIWSLYAMSISMLVVLAYCRKRIICDEARPDQLPVRRLLTVCIVVPILLAVLVSSLTEIDLEPATIVAMYQFWHRSPGNTVVSVLSIACIMSISFFLQYSYYQINESFKANVERISCSSTSSTRDLENSLRSQPHLDSNSDANNDGDDERSAEIAIEIVHPKENVNSNSSINDAASRRILRRAYTMQKRVAFAGKTITYVFFAHFTLAVIGMNYQIISGRRVWLSFDFASSLLCISYSALCNGTLAGIFNPRYKRIVKKCLLSFSCHNHE